MTCDNDNPRPPRQPVAVDLIEVISDFAGAVGRAKDLSTLGDSIVGALLQQSGFTEAAIWAREADPAQYGLLACVGQHTSFTLPRTLPGNHSLITCLADSCRLLRYEQKRASRVEEALAPMRAAICIPLHSHKGLVGLCILGPPSRDIQLSETDIAVTQAIARIAGNALDQHMAQDDLRRSSTLMRRADRLRSLEIMTDGFAHEIRNPLTSIKTFIQLAPQRLHDSAFIKDFSRLAIEDVHRIERLLHEILDYAGSIIPHPTDADLNELVTSCLGFVSSAASQRGTRLHTDLAPDLPLLSVDRQQIKQVLFNLLLNALDAMPDGHGVISIQTRLLPLVDGASWVQVRVKDEGCGIAPEHLEHIFDPFFTTKHSDSVGDGAGLGLTTAYQIVHDHGGLLQVGSQVGVGSTFSVHLPAQSVHTTVSAARE
ncbi:MAG: putative Histidine kinase, contains domain [Nitrospira sp.]|jgi:signal transduction histidine kinase|nr:putative Histidine kinase, contains domain [Nitrospira sp.]